MSDNDTLRFYADNAATYAGRNRGEIDPQLHAFARALPRGAKVLELGTGSGRDAAFLIEQGFDVTPSDGSPDLAAEAEKLLGRPVRVMRFDELTETDAYDGIWACASLLHAPAAELPDDLARIFRALRPGGLFVASFKAGEGEGRDGFGRYYNYPSPEALRAYYAAAADWGSFAMSEVMGSGYDNLPTRWLWVTVRK